MDRHRVALHEAAHAAAGIRLGRSVQCARIDRPDDRWGSVHYAYGPHDELDLRDVITSLVGYMVDGTPEDEWPPKWPLRRDELESLGLLVEYLELTEDAYNDLVQTARDMVDHPDFVELMRSIQRWLLAVPVLTGEDIDELRQALAEHTAKEATR